MASHALPSSTSAVAVVAYAQEDLTKKTEDALRMDCVRQRNTNSPFEAFCTRLKICSLNDILTVLPTILKGLESEMVEERLSAHFLLDALSENSKIKNALTHLLEKTDCSAYYSSAKILEGLCPALEKAGMSWESIQILIGPSLNQDVNLRAVACEHLCHLMRRSGAIHGVGDKIFDAAIYCQGKDDDQSKDLSVAYFETLFQNAYFLGKKVAAFQLSPVIQQARKMLVSETPIRVSNAEDFFREFMALATPEQFALLPEDIVKEWKECSTGTTGYEEVFNALWEQYQKRTAEAISSSGPASAAVVVVNAPEDLVSRTEKALQVDNRQPGPDFEIFSEWLGGCNFNDILTVLPMVLRGYESEGGLYINAVKLLSELARNNKFGEALQHLLGHTDCHPYYNSARMLRGLCSALEMAGMGRQRFEILEGASEKQDVGLRTVACELLCHPNEAFLEEDTLFLAALRCLKNDDSKHLAVKYFEALFRDGYFYKKEFSDDQITPVIEQAQRMLLGPDPLKKSFAKHFFLEFIKNATQKQFHFLSETAEAWRKYLTHEKYERRVKPLLEQYQTRASGAVSSS